jgi:hypothetical protein
MCGFNSFCFQGIAQRTRHRLCVAEFRAAPLHRRTEKIGACIADPFANRGEGAEEIDTLTIPNGRRAAGCIDPAIALRATAPTVNPNDAP